MKIIVSCSPIFDILAESLLRMLTLSMKLQQAARLAQHKDWKQEETASLAVSECNKNCLLVPLKLIN